MAKAMACSTTLQNPTIFLSKPKLTSTPHILRPTPHTVEDDPLINSRKRGGSVNRPDRFGHFGQLGGKFVPETLVQPLTDLELAFRSLSCDQQFQKEMQDILRDYVGRESPLCFAERLTERYRRSNGKGPEIYLKREDVNHTGAHTINNAVSQALLAKRLGKTRIVAETGSGQHGVSTAAICARLGLRCIIYMGAEDMKTHADSVFKIELMGAEVRPVHSGSARLKDAAAEAIRDLVENLESTHYISGSAVGPHPYPMMVSRFQSVTGQETRRQAMERWGRNPDVLIACVGGGSNAIGLFLEFADDPDVRLIGVEAAGQGLETNRHAATFARGGIGVFHGAMSYLLQDEEGQIMKPCSVTAGLEYPGVGPQLGYLKDIGRAEYHSITDTEAMAAFKRLSEMEGVVPALEASHAIAYLEVLCPTLSDGAKVVVNCSGRGDKDLMTVAKKHSTDLR